MTAQGLLLKRGRAQCYKRRSALKKVKLRPCQFFVFQETVIICHDTVAEPQIGIGQNLEYMSSFKVKTFFPGCAWSSNTYKLIIADEQARG